MAVTTTGLLRPESPVAPASRVNQRPLEAEHRDVRLDLFRGIALWFIYLDHIPDNAFAWLTLRNYGFSDTTEIFFFVSGYTCALAYGQAVRDRGWLVAVKRILQRAIEIYTAFLLLIVFYVGAIAATSGTDRPTLDATNTAVLQAQPDAALLHALTLTWMPVNTDVLPTFAILHAMFAAVLLALMYAPALTLAASCAIYLAVQIAGINLPTWPDGSWYFNPFAWQILFVLGASIAMSGGDCLGRIVRSRAALVAAVAYLLVSLVVALGWAFEPLKVLVPETVAQLIYPIDKSSLSPFRLMHFLALAIVAMRWIPANLKGFSSPVAVAAVRCGENSLLLYSVSVILSLLAAEALTGFNASLWAQALASAGGIGAMIMIAVVTSRFSKLAETRAKAF